MNRDSAGTWVLGAWAAMIIIITARQLLADSTKLPKANTYLGSAVLFTLIWGGSLIAPPLAVAIAWGTVFGALASPYLKGSSNTVFSQLSTKLNSISGGS